MCPKCGGPVHRSRTRGFSEKVVKTLTANRTYRCFDCGWRGWLETTDIPQLIESRRRRFLRTISVLVTILVTALLALYLVRKTQASSLPASDRTTLQQGALLEERAGPVFQRLSEFGLDSRSGLLQQWMPRRFFEL